ncbi:MAG: hypothetical protein Q9191_008060 [Dirinaria sp. TL-2023a]
MQGTLAVVSQSGESLSFFDLASGERTAHLPNLHAEPHELCFDAKRNLLYVSHAYRHGHFWVHGEYGHEISVIDGATKTCVDTIDTFPALGPHGLVLDESRDTLYVSVEELEKGKVGGLIEIDRQTRTITQKISSESKPHWFVMTPDGRKAYTCNKTQPFISIIDLHHTGGGSFVGKIPVPSCEEPGISPDGKRAYFPTPGTTMGPAPANASIQVIDTATDKIIGSFPTGLGPQSVYVTALNTIMVGKYSFDAATSAPGAGRLALYEAGTHALLGEVAVEKGPLTIRAAADGKTAFVANIFSGTVTVVDLVSMTVVRTLEVDLTPDPAKNNHLGAHGMALIP